MQNTNCGTCGTQLFRKIFKHCRKQLQQYFPGHELYNEEDEIAKLSKNHWAVINCDVDELEDRLRKLPPGRKQIATCRYENKVTVIVNELDILW